MVILFLCWVSSTDDLPKAHAMSPGQGSGAGQAIEDAYVLGSLLSDPSTTRETLPAVLKVFEEVRLPFANNVLRGSDRMSSLVSFGDPRSSALAEKDHAQLDAAELWEMGHLVLEEWKWCWTTHVEDDRKRAMALLREKTGNV